LKQTIEVKPLTDAEMFRFYKRPVLPTAFGYAARKGDLTVAIGGITIDDENRVWAFLDFKPGHRGGYMFKWFLKLLERAREDGIQTIWTSRDRAIPSSERFIRRAGFKLSEEQMEGHEIWVWHNEVNNHGSSHS
jgi:hypothetical protein